MLIIFPILAALPAGLAGWLAWTSWDYWMGEDDSEVSGDWPWYVYLLIAWMVLATTILVVVLGSGIIQGSISALSTGGYSIIRAVKGKRR